MGSPATTAAADAVPSDVFLVGLTLLGSYLYLFKPPIAEYRQLKQTRAVLAVEAKSAVHQAAELDALKQELERLHQRLYGGDGRLPAKHIEAYIVGQLDQISARHEVQLVSVTPGAGQEVAMFQEIPFDIKITGDLFSLFEWLHELEKGVGPITVKQFEITPEAAFKRLSMKLTMVSYRAVGEVQ